MKKFTYLALLLVLLVYSCTPDQNDPSVQNTPDGSGFQKASVSMTAFKASYITLINSQDYIILHGLRKDFADRMNFNGSPSTLSDETKLLNWISSNIAQTNFINYNDAVSRWNIINQKQKVLITQYPFYSYANDFDVKDIRIVIMTPPASVTTNGCEDGCNGQYNSCNTLADMGMAQYIDFAAELISMGYSSGASTALSVGANQWCLDLAACDSGLGGCLSHC